MIGEFLINFNRLHLQACNKKTDTHTHTDTCKYVDLIYTESILLQLRVYTLQMLYQDNVLAIFLHAGQYKCVPVRECLQMCMCLCVCLCQYKNM